MDLILFACSVNGVLLFSHLNIFPGMKLPSGYAAKPYRMRFYPALNTGLVVGNYVYEASTDGVHYTTIATGKGATEGWNYLTTPDSTANTWFRYFRYRAVDTATASQCQLAELLFTGILGATNSTCKVTVTHNTQSTVVAAVTYSESVTPVVHSVSPNNGTALGGTLVTVIGHGFSPFHGANGSINVAFSGVNCQVVSANNTAIRCITGARLPEDVRMSRIDVFIPGNCL